MELLELGWYWNPPWDFEHKQLLLFAYLSKVDAAFSKKTLSPWLLHTERLVNQIVLDQKKIEEIESVLKCTRVEFSELGPRIVETRPSRPEELGVVLEILDYSLPQLEYRLETGKDLYQRWSGLIW
jgi:hypothetical protein